jgi:O-antigen/teichoic acid export membrane protein
VINAAPPASVRASLLANLAGQGWSAALQLALLPVYLHFLGIEAYGVVSLYWVLLASVQVFDLGLAQTLNRELARSAAGAQPAREARDLARTVELVYWAIVGLVSIGLLVVVPYAVGRLVHPRALDPAELQTALVMLVAVVALQWPGALYQAGLMGLQRPVAANLLRIAIGTAFSGGAALVLWLVSPTLTAFYGWQIAVAGVGVVCSALVFRKYLPEEAGAARFRPALLKPVWRFALGMYALTVTGVLLTQMDKWILAALLPLEAFGHYALAWALAAGLALLTMPVFSAIYPRFSVLVARGEDAALLDLYHLTTQLLAATVCPLALLLALYAEPVLALWTGNGEIAREAAPLLTVLVLGSLLNSLAHPPYASELAHGRTRAFLQLNLVSAAMALPLILLLAPRVGAMSGALVWFAVNAAYFFAAIPRVHRQLPRAARIGWLGGSVGLPLGVSAATLLVLHALFPAEGSGLTTLVTLIGALGAAAAGALCAAPRVRAAISRRLAG